MQPVKSSNIEAIGYEGTTLTVKFRSGSTWSYHDVPEDVHRDLMQSKTIGGFYSLHIRNKYKGTKHEG